MSNYLDKDGLIRLWSKIKAYINDSVKNVADEFTDEEIEEICDFEEGMTEDDVIPKATKSALGCVVVGDGLDVDGNGVLSNSRGIDLLWENASPTSAFAAQTINLDLSEYDYILINSRYSTTDISETTTLIRVGYKNSIVVFYYISSTTQYGAIRSRVNVTASTTGITFPSSYAKAFNSNKATESNEYQIPTIIYGIKGVS